MQPIYPLHEDTIKQFCGMPVCAVTHDGERHIGVLTRCHGGKLMFNEREGSALQNASSTVHQGKVTNTKTKAKTKTKKGKKAVTEAKPQEAAQTQAFYPYDPYYDDPYYGWGDAFFLDLASLAFLFLLI
ncbi:hypothetical protein [Paenibacillus montanisoli]|uniref:Uncharacterized protein n=1 Tax=Paenibacillus montanisoli TaxID=2081970 RepID=A0A328U7M6_9BACL|nr:hypothetical protein [Paenibacillus montanisoli]RAP76965.1 hypothetical protein DL346_00185 [Paenibacillus montanisoli]